MIEGFLFQFDVVRRTENYEEPYVSFSCPRQCSTSYTVDYRKYCTCPILYFILSPEYVQRLPHFNKNFYSGLLSSRRQPTVPTITDPTTTPVLRTRRKFTTMWSVLGQVCNFFFLFFIFEKRKLFSYLFFLNFS